MKYKSLQIFLMFYAGAFALIIERIVWDFTSGKPIPRALWYDKIMEILTFQSSNRPYSFIAFAYILMIYGLIKFISSGYHND